MPQYLGGGVPQLGDALGVDRERRRSRKGMVERDAAIDLAALELPDEQLAQHRIQRAELFREAQLEIEIAMVDRTQLHGQRSPRQFGRNGREAGHAQDHRFRLRGCSEAEMPGEIEEKVNEIFTLSVGLPRM